MAAGTGPLLGMWYNHRPLGKLVTLTEITISRRKKERKEFKLVFLFVDWKTCRPCQAMSHPHVVIRSQDWITVPMSADIFHVYKKIILLENSVINFHQYQWKNLITDNFKQKKIQLCYCDKNIDFCNEIKFRWLSLLNLFNWLTNWYKRCHFKTISVIITR